MNGYFISRSGTRHILGPGSSQLPGRIAALCGFSHGPDDEPPGEEIRICGWCLEAEERARRITMDALDAPVQPAAPARNLFAPQDPEASV
jgi:hypothetical protein